MKNRLFEVCFVVFTVKIALDCWLCHEKPPFFMTNHYISRDFYIKPCGLDPVKQYSARLGRRNIARKINGCPVYWIIHLN